MYQTKKDCQQHVGQMNVGHVLLMDYYQSGEKVVLDTHCGGGVIYKAIYNITYDIICSIA